MIRLAVLVLAAAVALAPASPALAQDVPTVTVGRAQVAPGDPLQVRGAAWPVGDLVTLELCGNDALDASADCDVGGSRSVAVGADGQFFGTIVVEIPPKPCPCVVRVTGRETRHVATAPVDVPAAGFVAAAAEVPRTDVSRMLEIADVEVRDVGSWTSWLGGAAERIAAVEVRNAGAHAVSGATLLVSVGRGSDPSGVVGSTELAALAPGETHRVVVPFELGPLSFGRYTVQVSATGLGGEVTQHGSTSTYPWALIAVAAVALQAVLLAIRNAVRRRVAPPVVGADAAASLPWAPPALPIAVAAGADRSVFAEPPPPVAAPPGPRPVAPRRSDPDVEEEATAAHVAAGSAELPDADIATVAHFATVVASSLELRRRVRDATEVAVADHRVRSDAMVHALDADATSGSAALRELAHRFSTELSVETADALDRAADALEAVKRRTALMHQEARLARDRAAALLVEIDAAVAEAEAAMRTGRADVSALLEEAGTDLADHIAALAERGDRLARALQERGTEASELLARRADEQERLLRDEFHRVTVDMVTLAARLAVTDGRRADPSTAST